MFVWTEWTYIMISQTVFFLCLSELSDLIMLSPPPPQMNVFKLSIFIVLKETCKLYFFIVSYKTYKIVILVGCNPPPSHKNQFIQYIQYRCTLYSHSYTVHLLQYIQYRCTVCTGVQYIIITFDLCPNWVTLYTHF